MPANGTTDRTRPRDAAEAQSRGSLGHRCTLRADEGWSGSRIAAALNCSRSHANRTTQRFADDGLCGLIDRREDNGTRKADEAYVAGVRASHPASAAARLRPPPHHLE